MRCPTSATATSTPRVVTLESSLLSPAKRHIETTAASTAAEAAGGIGYASLALGIAGGLAMLTGVGAVATPYLFAAAAAAGAASSGLSLYDESGAPIRALAGSPSTSSGSPAA